MVRSPRRPASEAVEGAEETSKHFAALPWKEAGAFMEDLADQNGMGALALRFAILCGSRSGEVRGATWKEIGKDNETGLDVWTIPAARMKAGKEHRVPLSDAALAVLQEMAEVGTDPDALIFPGIKAGKPLSDMSLTAVLRRMDRGDLTAHGFRSDVPRLGRRDRPSIRHCRSGARPHARRQGAAALTSAATC